MTPPKDQAPGLVARLRGEGDAHLRGLVRDRRTIGSMMLAGADRITQLEGENAELRGKLEKAYDDGLRKHRKLPSITSVTIPRGFGY